MNNNIMREILIIIVILSLILIYNYTKIENFDVLLENKKEKKDNYENKLKEENKDLKYFYNDKINDDGIKENSDDIINNRDKIDYSKVITGYEKCNKECNGICFIMGYTGNATCYPKY
jgi:hypothetical protein